MEKEITKILDELSVSKELNGYQYLYTAIEMTAKEPRMVLDGIGKLYEAIAKKYGITPRGVESAVYSLLEKTWFYGDIDVQNSYFGYTINNSRGKPTSSEFIAMIADHASLRAENDPLKTEVTKILHQLGVPANVKGYGYLRTAIMMAVKNPTLTDAMIAGLYKSVAKEYQSNVGHVYRAILRAINIAWDRGDEIWYVSYFGYESVTLGGVEYNHVQKPTPGKFITVIANHINSKEH